ncbi:hypothetical protein SBRY_60276 [Actinacidiphila bryophytorum]|uniref:Uncharacterized protein n=1 Tax=Actinacidiphila bryophytorum TaxID=1436133 RepID=A0A9W4MG86_9ACTN|nr:hypothetical protein SBRY_60276 [Actinacidiphila bryophytorum]
MELVHRRLERHVLQEPAERGELDDRVQPDHPERLPLLDVLAVHRLRFGERHLRRGGPRPLQRRLRPPAGAGQQHPLTCPVPATGTCGLGLAWAAGPMAARGSRVKVGT